MHLDRLPSIVADSYLWCDAEIARRTESKTDAGTMIGMNSIKLQRLNEIMLNSHPGLYVGHCVPFYFCPQSIMLYVIHCANHPELTYRGGQGAILHLEADLRDAIRWADRRQRRWAFTLSNAGAYYFEDHADLTRLGELDRVAIDAPILARLQRGQASGVPRGALVPLGTAQPCWRELASNLCGSPGDVGADEPRTAS